MKNAPPTSLAAFFLHWILANATAVGFMGAIAATVNLTHETPTFVGAGLILLAALGSIYAWGFAQQVVLIRQFPQAKHWAMLFPVSLVFGAYAALFLGFCVAMALVEGTSWFLGGLGPSWSSTLGVGAVAMIFGCGASVLQAAHLSLGYRGGLTWMLTCAMAWGGATITLTVVSEFSGEVIHRTAIFRGISLAATAAGAVYGIGTGAGLMWLLPDSMLTLETDSAP